MEEQHLYRRIAEAIRRQILGGQLSAGDRLPSVRALTQRWNCTIGTVQRAYQELAAQGLVISRAGQGTHVVEHRSMQSDAPLRRAALIHRAEAFLLEVLTAGHTPEEVEAAVRQALDRWRVIADQADTPVSGVLRFAGSHDPAVAWLATHFGEIAPGYNLNLSFSGSLGGLISLAQNQADLAGCHLWDEETDSYNQPFIRRLLPGRRMALVRLACRRIGLIVPPGNPANVHGLADLIRPGQRFLNRQSGSGTRVWLDAQLYRLGISAQQISGYANEESTHSRVAQAVAEGNASTALGLEAAALIYGLSFVPLTQEQYDLVIPQEKLEHPAMLALRHWLTEEAHSILHQIGGYDDNSRGQITWVN